MWREPSADDAAAPTLPMVNLHCSSMRPCTEECTLFCTTMPEHFARGMSHVFDQVPHNIYNAVHGEVEACFSSRRTFYYCQNGEQLISPAEQEAVAAVMKRHGLPSPQFDAYEDCYVWE